MMEYRHHLRQTIRAAVRRARTLAQWVRRYDNCNCLTPSRHHWACESNRG